MLYHVLCFTITPRNQTTLHSVIKTQFPLLHSANHLIDNFRHREFQFFTNILDWNKSSCLFLLYSITKILIDNACKWTAIIAFLFIAHGYIQTCLPKVSLFDVANMIKPVESKTWCSGIIKNFCILHPNAEWNNNRFCLCLLYRLELLDKFKNLFFSVCKIWPTHLALHE